MKYRDDIDPATTWIISDTHFGHENIVGYCHRPLDHDQLMIAEWRKWIPDDHTVLHLGDLAYKGNARFKHVIAPELTGARKLLIKGNHDRQRFSFYRDCGFRVVAPFAIRYQTGEFESLRRCSTCGDQLPLMACTECQGRGWVPVMEPLFSVVSFSHYPWNVNEDGQMGPGDVRVHGHIHNNGYTRDAYVPFLRQHINVSIEQTKYRPVNLKLLLDAALLGEYPETTEEQLAEAREKKREAKANGL